MENTDLSDYTHTESTKDRSRLGMKNKYHATHHARYRYSAILPSYYK